ncbi:MAG: MerR family transcriptional regulator [Clostridia bacterium]|nr:MerR family transcriptional regulator [Clostridia bacterium]MBQ5813753.1 MerR family transcriptional regulator [Clostridia bacterium]
MMTVKEVSRITGLSVRTLHHYDSIGLLKPAEVSEAGYRLYDKSSLERIQIIMLFRELEFPLREIAEIIDDPGFDTASAISQQIELLTMKRDRLNDIISLARILQTKGADIMGFSAFDKTQINEYAAEAKAKWGNTEAYKEYEARSGGKTKDELNGFGAEMMDIFARMGSVRTSDPAGDEVQALVKELQQYITDHFYTCTKEILSGLGQMYVMDERFKKNIDAHGGEGTAEFVSEAIKIYCK